VSTPRSSLSLPSGCRTSRWDTARMAGGSINSSVVGNWTATRRARAIPGTCGARCRWGAGSYTCCLRCDIIHFTLLSLPSHIRPRHAFFVVFPLFSGNPDRTADTSTQRPLFPSSRLVSSGLWPSTRPAQVFRRSSASYRVLSSRDSSAFGRSSSRV
jgi:hypothetical protein